MGNDQIGKRYGAANTYNTAVQLRRDTAANWAAVNPVLKAGEIGLIVPSPVTASWSFKIGDGVSSWSGLSSFNSSGPAPEDLAAAIADYLTDNPINGNGQETWLFAMLLNNPTLVALGGSIEPGVSIECASLTTVPSSVPIIYWTGSDTDVANGSYVSDGAGLFTYADADQQPLNITHAGELVVVSYDATSLGPSMYTVLTETGTDYGLRPLGGAALLELVTDASAYTAVDNNIWTPWAQQAPTTVGDALDTLADWVDGQPTDYLREVNRLTEVNGVCGIDSADADPLSGELDPADFLVGGVDGDYLLIPFDDNAGEAVGVWIMRDVGTPWVKTGVPTCALTKSLAAFKRTQGGPPGVWGARAAASQLWVNSGSIYVPTEPTRRVEQIASGTAAGTSLTVTLPADWATGQRCRSWNATVTVVEGRGDDNGYNFTGWKFDQGVGQPVTSVSLTGTTNGYVYTVIVTGTPAW